jgi:hypothetical protein
MKICRIVTWGAVAAVVLVAVLVRSQAPLRSLTQTGQIVVAGEPHAYVLHYLPVTSFPQLPPRAAAELTRRGCLIPQTWQARRPENVIKASLEQPGSQDWAALCSVEGTVSLLVFFASGSEPVVLAEAQELSRLRPIGVGIQYGFNWGIDPATPEQVHQAQAGLLPRPAWLDHDALADISLEGRTTYHFFTRGAWTSFALPN